MPRKLEQGSLLTWRAQTDLNNREAAPPLACCSRSIASLGSHSHTAANPNKAISSDEALIDYDIDDSINVDASDPERYLAPEGYNASDEAAADIRMTGPLISSSSPVSLSIADDILAGKDINDLFDFVCYHLRRMFGMRAKYCVE